MAGGFRGAWKRRSTLGRTRRPFLAGADGRAAAPPPPPSRTGSPPSTTHPRPPTTATARAVIETSWTAFGVADDGLTHLEFDVLKPPNLVTGQVFGGAFQAGPCERESAGVASLLRAMPDGDRHRVAMPDAQMLYDVA
jgi:hypothetical protein